jgi:peptidoglycan LD-endopeptidase CwlK
MPVDRRQGLNPTLLEKVDRVLTAMSALGHPMKIVQGFRTVEEQQALFAQGRTLPGKRVTNCDGVSKKSNHQAANDGLGRAVDCAFLKDGKVVWDGPWEAYGAAGKAVGLNWGGDWKDPVDRPHLELPKN